ncbi:MAG: type II toxin-antitoxin system RelE/ParE family toxin [Gammaproteobacteria bacterium]|nr:type II toxin-antitoxin system RelE/ParE family toxin [Gammaproteobacteria bacterium]
MGNYKIVFKKSVSKDLRPIPNKDIARILQRMNELQENPRPVGSEKLSGKERYRIRQGVYRIIYEVADELLVVTVVKVGHRKHVYKRS